MAGARGVSTAVGSGAVLSLGAALVGPVVPAGAATFTVTNNGDGGAGSLRQAVLDANAAAGDDEITFAPGLGAITLTSGQIAITDGLTLTGPGQEALTVSGNNASRIFYVNTPNAVTISGVTLTDGRTTGTNVVGGAVRSRLSDLTIHQSTIRDSGADFGGGGLAAAGGSLTLSESLVTGNGTLETEGSIRGGGVLAYTSSLVITDTTFSGNTAGAFYGYGGGLNSSAATATISGSTFEGNHASRSGGAAFLSGGPVTIHDTSVTGNSSLFAGGLKFAGASAVITDSTISDNGAGFYGGGIGARGFSSATLTVTGSTISGNVLSPGGGSLGGGGGLRAREMGEVTIEATTLAGNQVPEGPGGGLWLDDVHVSTITGSTISGNTADAGGGLFIEGGESASIASSTISGNTASYFGGGGLFVLNTVQPVSFDHSTIAANDATNGGGGLWLQDEAATFDHTIVGDNTPAGSDIVGGGAQAQATLAHSLVESTPTGVVVTDGGGNVNGVDPLLSPLADNGGPTFTHALAPASPAFDAGDPGFTPPPATDQRGLPRVSGDALDIGAFEEQVIPVVLPGGASVGERNAGTRVVNVPVRLSTASGFPVTVDWATLDSVDQPAEGVDYESASGTVTFAPGELLKTVPITVLGDTTWEPNEWVPVAFTNPSGATIGGFFGLGFGVIRDDDPVPTILPGGGAVFEGDAGTQIVNVKVTLSNPSSVPITVHWTTADSLDQPAEGVDYESASGELTFAPGETLKLIPITVLGDLTDEPDEWLAVALSDAANATIGGSYGLGLGLIRDDD